MSDPRLHFSVPHLSGVKPGALDPTQPARILCNPSSVLIFATYDPVAFASVGLDVALPPDARIIVEHTPGSGQANWFRLIPPPRLAPGVRGEDGSWPKVILLNGYRGIFVSMSWSSANGVLSGKVSSLSESSGRSTSSTLRTIVFYHPLVSSPP